MREVLAYVAANPGCAKIGPARHVAPHPETGLQCGLQFGYRSVDRAIAAGLVSPGTVAGPYALELTGAGREVLSSSS
jgi:hypothetical protein